MCGCGTTDCVDALVDVGQKVRIADETTVVAEFTRFVRDHERRLRQGLIAAWGGELGREAASEALAYAWENWSRVCTMENPTGYLYTVGRNWALRSQRPEPRPLRYLGSDTERYVEPGLAAALAGLSERQRAVVVMVHCFDWSLSETADFLGVAKTTTQNHLERGMTALRRELGEA